MTRQPGLALAMSPLVTVAVSAVGWLSYHGLQEVLLPRSLDRTEAHSRLVASDLQLYVRGARGDVASFRSAVALQGLLRAHLAGGIDPGRRYRTDLARAGRRTSVLRTSSCTAYAQFRMIGIEDGGREMVRVDRSGPGGEIRLVPDAELQRKGDRPYFTDTISLQPGEIYVSAVDLAQEMGVIETLSVPTLRIATQLPGSDGKPFGIIIINIDMRPVFDRVRASARQGGGIYVVNRREDYLVNRSRARIRLGTGPAGKPTFRTWHHRSEQRKASCILRSTRPPAARGASRPRF